MVEDAGFESFVRAHLDALYGYARFLTGDEHDAWDAVQEALTRMGARWSRIDLDDNPAGYARTAIARLVTDGYRRGRRERPVATLPEEAWEQHVPDGVAPWLAVALRTLPLRQRTALVLRVVDDLDFAAIATTMGCSVGTARSHVSRALATLRTQAPATSSLATIKEDGGV